MSSADQTSWTTVISKRKKRREKQFTNKEKLLQKFKERDIQYLKTQNVFQAHRLTEKKIRDLTAKRKNDDLSTENLFIVSSDRCVGHLVRVDELQGQECLQCSWACKSFDELHCCCPIKLKTALPINFYLGCDGTIAEYLNLVEYSK